MIGICLWRCLLLFLESRLSDPSVFGGNVIKTINKDWLTPTFLKYVEALLIKTMKRMKHPAIVKAEGKESMLF